jgi:O-antigen ligase
LEADQAPYVKEAHNDYLATLLERGLIGALGLLALGVAIATRCVRLLVATVPEAFRDAVPRAYLLVVTAPIMATAGGFYEVLHFRHLWTWLGIVAALTLAISDEERKRR